MKRFRVLTIIKQYSHLSQIFQVAMDLLSFSILFYGADTDYKCLKIISISQQNICRKWGFTQKMKCSKIFKSNWDCLFLSLPQYHINKLSIMSSDNHMNNSEKEVDEVDAALSDLEITLEGGKTSNTLVWQHHHSFTSTIGNTFWLWITCTF